MASFNFKLENELLPKINQIKNIRILELGVQKGRSTLKFLEVCKKNNGKLFSVDISDCSGVTKDPRWTFIHCKDNNFTYIKKIVKDKIDVLFIDTLHEAEHVSEILKGYYNIVKEGGYIFIDDISHIPYLNNSKRNNFYCEINNRETFNKILDIYTVNQDNFDLSFSFISSGLAILKKNNNKSLVKPKKIVSREFSIKNIIRKLWSNLIKI